MSLFLNIIFGFPHQTRGFPHKLEAYVFIAKTAKVFGEPKSHQRNFRNILGTL